jgi:hypothetical protein
MANDETSNAEAADTTGPEPEPNPETAGVILEAIVREYDFEFERFKQVDQKTAILLALCSAALVFVATRTTQAGPPDGWSRTPWASLSPFTATVCFLVAVVCLFLSIGWCIHSLWCRGFTRLGLDEILEDKELGRGARDVRAALARVYAEATKENGRRIGLKVRSWQWAAGFAVAGITLLVAQGIVWPRPILGEGRGEPAAFRDKAPRGKGGHPAGGAYSWTEPALRSPCQDAPWSHRQPPGKAGTALRAPDRGERDERQGES